MSVTKTIPRDYAIENLKTILLGMGNEDNRLQEFIFPARMIEDYCTQRHYPLYRFAHDPNEQPYMRARIDGITLEFLVLKSSAEADHEQARICQIFASGKIIYRRPGSPVGTICIT